MPHQVHLRTLGRTSDHRLSMLRNLAVAVLRYERVRTTEAKAKEVRRFVDRAMGLGREGTVLARRRAIALLRDRLIVEKVFDEFATRYTDRGSGFTRLVRLGHRVGDGAPMMLVELVEGAATGDAATQPAAEKAAEPAAEPKGPAARARELARRVTGARAKAEPKEPEKAKGKAKGPARKAKAEDEAAPEKRAPRARKKAAHAAETKKPAPRKKKEME